MCVCVCIYFVYTFNQLKLAYQSDTKEETKFNEMHEKQTILSESLVMAFHSNNVILFLCATKHPFTTKAGTTKRKDRKQ